jgi:hypothetical protein
VSSHNLNQPAWAVQQPWAVQLARPGQQNQLTEALAPEEKETEPLPLPMQMSASRVTLTPVDWPAARLPPPLALMPPRTPATLQFTGPPCADTVTVQLREPCMVHPETASVPGPGWAGGGGTAGGGAADVGGPFGCPWVLCLAVGVGVGVPLEPDGVGVGDVAPSLGRGAPESG